MFFQYAKGHVKISSIIQRQKIPEGICMTRKLFFSQLETAKTYPSQPKTFQKLREKIEIFSKIFSMKVSGKSHSAENPTKSFMLAKHFAFSKVEGGLR